MKVALWYSKGHVKCLRDHDLAACLKAFSRAMRPLAGSLGTQALDQVLRVEGRKPGHLSHTFSKWKRWDFG